MASSVGGDASPQSPQSPAQPAIDGAELARRMLMATEAASMAASTAAQALLELKIELAVRHQMRRLGAVCCLVLACLILTVGKQSWHNGGNGAGAWNSI